LLDRVLASPNVARVIESLPVWLRDEVTATARLLVVRGQPLPAELMRAIQAWLMGPAAMAPPAA
jgi:hypothetical protein